MLKSVESSSAGPGDHVGVDVQLRTGGLRGFGILGFILGFRV